MLWTVQKHIVENIKMCAKYDMQKTLQADIQRDPG